MDPALKLRTLVDSGENISIEEARELLEESDLVKLLTGELKESPLYYVWRIIALSEIPFSITLKYTEKLLDRIIDSLGWQYGFSLSGNEKQFLPCYNAMIIKAFCKLGLFENEYVQNGINWINDVQAFKRNHNTIFSGLNFDKYGGCFKNVPCYIGLSKSVFALFEYQKRTKKIDVSKKLNEGTQIILDHHFLFRKTDHSPITNHILDISFPESCHLNIVDLLQFSHKAGLNNDVRAKEMIDLIEKRRTKKLDWKISYGYKGKGFLLFDQPGKSSDWVTHILKQCL